jgi:Rps23 Pro-64 3,4-dihydroxylase Tpa1-like proline 4-hydroxylase
MIIDWIEPDFLIEEKKKELKQSFQNAKPFPYLEIQDFFISEKLQIVLSALAEEKFNEKASDLFQFMQTNDLKQTNNSVLKEFIDTLYSQEFIDFMQDITGLSFTPDIVDIAGTLYQDTDYLLCHDDELDGRKIAFLIYLSDVEKDEGGALALYENTEGKPTKITQRIHPKFNSFSFFEVSPISFHEVEEIVKPTQRIAIGGWLHEN